MTLPFPARHVSGLQSGFSWCSLEFALWAYTQTSLIETEKPRESVRCIFEHFRAGIIMRHEFSIPVQGHKLGILDVWNLLRFSFDHIEQRDPTTRIMRLTLCLNDTAKAIVAYRVGAQVKRSEEQTSELQSLMRIAYAVLCLKKKPAYTNQI